MKNIGSDGMHTLFQLFISHFKEAIIVTTF